MTVLIKNASEILTMKEAIGVIKNGSLCIEDGIITDIGTINREEKDFETIDATGCVVCPGFVDSHTHLVFAGTREDEFVMRMRGVRYEKIAKAGGGIASTVKKTRAASEDELFTLAQARISGLVRHGTTTVEIKSGYGLSRADEFKILRVIKRLQENTPIDIIPTYLVHTIPFQMRRRDYVDVVIEEIIPAVAEQHLALFCDIFCDKTAFTVKESKKILTRARECGFKLKIHADELSNSGGARLAARLQCTSADHLIYTTKNTIKHMNEAGVIPTLLPGTSLFLRSKKKPNIKAFRETHAPVAIASDFNPGTCMIYSMPKIIALACILYGMDIEDALMGATLYGAQALDVHQYVGSLEPGKQADIVILNVDHYKKIPYQFGEDMVKYTIKKGRVIYGEDSRMHT
jgi:imidazolonepropionase